MAVGSRRALALALRNWLRTATGSGGLGLTDDECDVMPDGRPPASWGSSSLLAFYSVHQGSRTRVGEDTRLEQDFVMQVTVSVLVDRPFDRVGVDIVEQADTGLDVRVDNLIACVQSNQWNIMNAANAILGVPAVNGFVEAIYYGSDGEPRPVYEDWFWGTKSRPSSRAKMWSRFPQTDGMFVGMVSTVQFPGAKRIQTIESATG